MTRLIHKRVLVQLDPEVRKIGSIWLPDEDSIKFCAKCHNLMEQLSDAPRCKAPDEIFEDDMYDRPVFRGLDFSHDIRSARAPVVMHASRFGTVIAVAPGVAAVCEGDRVLIPAFAGGDTDDLRMVPEGAILATVSE